MISTIKYEEGIITLMGRVFYSAIFILFSLLYFAKKEYTTSAQKPLLKIIRDSTPKSGTLVFFIAPLALAVYLYRNVGTFNFVWDDITLFINTPSLRSAAWIEHIWRPLPFSANYFRPLPLSLFAIELNLFNTSPEVMHWVNLLIHLINISLIFLLTLYLTRNHGEKANTAALIAAILYACHPTLVETTSWISGRFDQLSTFFMLAGLLAVSHIENRTKRALWTSACFFGATLSKESAVIFPAVVLIWLSITSKDKYSTSILQKTIATEKNLFISIFVTGLIYLLIRYTSIGHLVITDSKINTGSALQHLLLSCKSFYWYLKLSFWPFSFISPYHESTTPISLSDAEAWAGLMVFILFTSTTFYLTSKHPKSSAGYFFSLYILALFPLLHIFKPLTIGDNLVHDRFLTFALAIASIGIGYASNSKLISQNIKLTNALRIVIIPWLILSALTVNITTSFWRSNIVLWSWVSHSHPKSFDALVNLSGAFLEKGDIERALVAAQSALRLRPMDQSALINYAAALKRPEKNKEALEIYQRLIEQYGDSAVLSSNIGMIHLSYNSPGEAEIYLRRAIEFAPTDWSNIALLSKSLQMQGKYPEAKEQWATAVRLAPPNATLPIHSAIANIQVHQGE